MIKFLKHLPKIVGFVALVLPLTVAVNPAVALMEQLGVVKSPDNEKQWAEITSRLTLMDIDYCILEAKDWDSQSDLDNVRILLLPNVENMNGAQALALERWMIQGGKVIVTGPTGDLADPEVRSQLRTLFGGYWAYPLSSPSTLEPQAEQSWIGYDGLVATLNGAVLSPTETNTEIAAVWLAEGTPPAVIFTESSIVFGWRWGVDAVSPASTDIAWLTAALNRMGDFIATTENPEPKLCNAPAKNDNLIFPDWEKQQSKTQSKFFEIEQIQSMNKELEGLIERFETTLNMAEALDQSLDLPTAQVVEEILSSTQPTAIEIESKNKAQENSSHQILTEAKTKHQQFLESIKEKQYERARQQWFQTRRLLLDNYPTKRPLAQPEIRAMWLDRGTIVQAESPRELVRIFNRMSEAGINTVFFETLNASYPIYPSKIAPKQNPLVKGWDPLETAVTLAHERGMELHAWVWIFAAANQVHNVILNQPKDYLGPVLSLNPEWLMTNRQGQPFDYSLEQKKAFYDPANPEVQRYLLSLLSEISTRYQVDGIQLDYIRYPFQKPQANQSFGYSRESRDQFRALTGVDPLKITVNDPLWSDWTDFRINQVNNFVFTASRKLKQERPDLILSAAVFPISEQQRLETIQQDWEKWAQNEWIDMIVLMSYSFDTEQLELNTENILQEAQFESTLVIPGIRINVSDLVTLDKMQLLRNLPTDGYALFAAENFSPGLERILRQTQGNLEQPLPYRQPFETLAKRYQALQKEWSFLLTNNQLVMEENTMKEWSEQVDFLAQALNRLAEDPSRKNLLSAQIHLSSFQRKFEYWMWEHDHSNSYQVKSWENRLANLERLLNYGARTLKST